VIEPAAGLTRSFMAFLIEAYVEDEAPNTKGGMDKRTVLRLDPRLAPVKVAAPGRDRHPFCVTTDFDTLDDRAVTVRERDAMTQDRIGIDAVPDYLRYD
jgi:glycyl-tRNA synthetase